MTNALGYIEVLPSISLRATYHAHRAGFLLVAQQAADGMIEPRTGGHWMVDGHTSERLFLRMPFNDPECWPPYLEIEARLDFSPNTVTVSITSRLPSTLSLFEEFTEQLDRYLLRTTP